MSEQKIALRTIDSFLVLTNVLGNSLVILVILRSRDMKTPMNYLLLNLAVADLTAGVFYVPHSILNGILTFPRDPSGAVLCRLVTSSAFLTWTSFFCSASTLVIIASDRYYAIVKPFSTRHRATTKKLKIFIPFCWATGAILSIPTFYIWEYDNEERYCRWNWQTLISKVHILLWAFVIGIVPISIMSVLYSRGIYRLWFEENGNSPTLQALRRSRKKITKTMLILSVLYSLCCLPDYIWHVLEVFFPSHFSFSSGWSNVFHSLVLLNSTVNPFVYTFQFEQFRRESRKIFCCGRQGNRIHVTQRARGQNVADNGQVNLEMRRIDGT